uniref:B30.2/SPRY domain-containing protein n=1 Tax=Globodera pallida TaxID=36090 RepID=A0A183BMH3_GLOPA
MSITSESTNGDITADQEWTTFANLGPSEEKRQLLARIAELDRQQSMNSPISSANFSLVAQNGNAEVRDADTLDNQNEIEETMNMELEQELKKEKQLQEQLKQLQEQLKNSEESVGRKLEQIEEWNFNKNNTAEIKQLNMEELKQQQNQTKKNEAGERVEQLELKLTETNRKLEYFGNFQAMTVIKLEEYQKVVNAQQTKIVGLEENQKAMGRLVEEQNRELEELANNSKNALEKTIKANVVAELEHQKMLNAQKNLIEEMAEYQNEQQQTIDALTEKLKVSIDHFSRLQTTISDLERKMDESLKSAVQAVVVAELGGIGTIRQQNRWDSAACHRGLTLFEPDQLIVQNGGDWAVGPYEGSYAYEGDGTLWGPAAVEANGRCSFIEGQLKFGKGAVIGCGVNLATGQIFYTKDGQRLEATASFADSVAAGAELFPCVTLSRPGAKIGANFGPNFKYKFC